MKKSNQVGLKRSTQSVRGVRCGVSQAYALVGGVVLMGVLASSTLAGPEVAADTSSVDNVSITVPSACTLGGTIDPGDEHVTTMVSGQYKQDIGTTTLTAYCNDAGGFVIYAAGASGDGVGTTNGNKLVSSIGSSWDIPTGIDTSGTVSAWGMKLAVVETDYEPTLATFTTNADGYYAVPANYTTVAYRNPASLGGDASTDYSQGSKVETTYMVSTKGTQAAGTYVGKVSYAMMHPYSSSELVSLQRAFQKAGKSQITVGGKDYYKMQDMTSSICEATNIIGEASQVQLVDERDYNIYWATKLEDGKCWMTQNLDLDLTTSGVYNSVTQTTVPITSNNTNLTVASGDGYSTGYSESGGVITYTPSMATKDSSTGATKNDFSDWEEITQRSLPKSWNTGKWYEEGAYFASSSCNYLAGDCARFSQTPFTTNGTHGAVGNLYNYTQAIASNNSAAIAGNTAADPVGTNPKNSICPKGWRLPYVSNASEEIAGSTNEFARLNYLYNGNKTGSGLTDGDKGLFTAPLYFVRSGDVWSSKLSSPAYNGGYWSSTVSSDVTARLLYFHSSIVRPTDSGSRAYGFAVRCVAQ